MELKRYDLIGEYDTIEMQEFEDGDYYLVADVHREMIPRPDAEVARKAIKRLKDALNQVSFTLNYLNAAHLYDDAERAVKQAEAEVLRLMGVENA